MGPHGKRRVHLSSIKEMEEYPWLTSQISSGLKRLGIRQLGVTARRQAVTTATRSLCRAD